MITCTKYLYCIPRVPQCLSPRRKWDPPPPLPQASLYPPEPKVGWGAHSTASESVCGANSDDWRESPALCLLRGLHGIFLTSNISKFHLLSSCSRDSSLIWNFEMMVVFSWWFYCLSLADYIKSNDADNDDQGHKWSLRHVTRNSSSIEQKWFLITKKEKLNIYYIFWAAKSVLATPLLMSPIFVFFRDIWIRNQRAAVASSYATNLATHLSGT